MIEECLELVRRNCGVEARTLEELKTWISGEIASRKYADDLRRARRLIEEFERGIKNDLCFGKVYAHVYCATHNSIAWHHDWNAA